MSPSDPSTPPMPGRNEPVPGRDEREEKPPPKQGDQDHASVTSENATAENANAKPWMQLAGLGMELAGSTLGLAAIGYLVDRYRGKADGYGVAAGAFLGFSLGMFRFVQKAMREINKY